MSVACYASPRIQPCRRSLNSFLDCNRRLDYLAKSGRMSDARRLFDGMPQRDDVSWNTLIAAYARSGLFSDALHLFHSCPQLHSSSIPWSSLISGFSRQGRAADALLVFRRMLAAGLRPDCYSLGAYLRACSILPSHTAGHLAHALAIKSSLDADSFIAAALVNMYSKCGESAFAGAIFTSVQPEHRANRVLWTAIITARVQDGDHLSAMDCFRLMRAEDMYPNQFTLPSVLSACASELAIGFGKQVHTLAVHTGLDANQFIQSSLVSLYAKCSDFSDAKMVLLSAEHDDPVSWNSLIVICSHAALHDDVLSLFVQMRQRFIELDEFTHPSALNSVAAVEDLCNGCSLHCLVLKTGLTSHQHVSNALVDMYAKCGRPEIALKVFDDLQHKDIVGWTALYNGYAMHISNESALQLYLLMRAAWVEPDEFILSGVLSSCGELTLLESGRQVHALAIRLSLDSFRSVGNSTVTMYAKSGCIDEARLAFDSMSRRDAITWTAIIMGYAQNGRCHDSLLLFDLMVREGARPDYVTFIGLLFACSHAGLVEIGRMHFESMERVYGVTPGPEHYACMVDLLGRASRVSEAVDILSQAGHAADTTVWKTLLAASRVHCNVDVAEWAAKELLRLDPSDATTYVMLANVYSRAGRWMDVAMMRGMMRATGVSKEPGCSWVEAGGQVHVFHVEDRAHPLAAKIFAKVGEMLERALAEGYVVDTTCALQDATEEERERGLAHHSEKLAVAFGLMDSPKGKPIRVYKNLRICGDCHTAIKLVAKVYERVIVLRDANCFHHFSGGNCSCSDFW
ncbi:pentatricopeptide repeat-containing protein At2g03880, mitochondrial [Phalaenopsis equestris]|uniref:pentatricopeptide repeat-containing protein At2g03880, mitochondrial n=1 Tax=Phalaenopsis equestris TaxID=78828 RepID=UPI0009E380D0|nr:pentatricopeptide repeat-containing protein At2g03880, mitochondrial [Phalaenopsis equestris]